MMRKRSISLSGHATSIALEPEFWSALENLAASKGMPLAAFIASVDQGRDSNNLASALRLTVLRSLQHGHKPVIGLAAED